MYAFDANQNCIPPCIYFDRNCILQIFNQNMVAFEWISWKLKYNISHAKTEKPHNQNKAKTWEINPGAIFFNAQLNRWLITSWSISCIWVSREGGCQAVKVRLYRPRVSYIFPIDVKINMRGHQIKSKQWTATKQAAHLRKMGGVSSKG